MNDYLKERVERQREWYETKASRNKKIFIRYQTIIIILGALIPVLVAFEGTVPLLKVWGGPITALIAAFIAVIAGLDKLKQPQPNWFNYRANEETIKKEEWLYKYKAGQYRELGDKEANRIFIERIESIISADIARITDSKKEGGDAGSQTLPEIPSEQPGSGG
ncbi:MAG: DUF4231 domain-containing protein [Planctomycetota bacterium]|jgi:hypothetical protein